MTKPCKHCTIASPTPRARARWRRRLTLRRFDKTLRPRSRAADEAQQLIDLLSALGSTTFRQLLWQKSAELDLTYAQSQVLFYVAEHSGCRMGGVAKAFGVTLPAVTHIVDRLEQKGFVVRADHPVDRRVYVLGLTGAGQSLADELHALQLRGVAPVLLRMSANDRERLLKGLRALVEAARDAATEPARRVAAGAARDGARNGRRSNSHA